MARNIRGSGYRERCLLADFNLLDEFAIEYRDKDDGDTVKEYIPQMVQGICRRF